MKKNINRKGFTLIELLAVIIILAVIMVFAVPALLDTANNAKKKSLELYAERVGTKALEKATSDDMSNQLELNPETNDVYYNFTNDLNLTDVGSYVGCVHLERNSDKTSGFDVTVYLSDGKYCTPSGGVELENVSSFAAVTDCSGAITDCPTPTSSSSD